MHHYLWAQSGWCVCNGLIIGDFTTHSHAQAERYTSAIDHCCLLHVQRIPLALQSRTPYHAIPVTADQKLNFPDIQGSEPPKAPTTAQSTALLG